MRCACGWEMCYVCRQTIKGYNHFQIKGGCILHDDTVKRNKESVQKAENQAKVAYDKPTQPAEVLDLTNNTLNNDRPAKRQKRTHNNNNNNNNRTATTTTTTTYVVD